MAHTDLKPEKMIEKYSLPTPTPRLTLLLVLGKSCTIEICVKQIRVKQGLGAHSFSEISCLWT